MKNVVQDLTSGGVDWQREKWQSGFGSKFIRQGEKNAVKYADEIDEFVSNRDGNHYLILADGYECVNYDTMRKWYESEAGKDLVESCTFQSYSFEGFYTYAAVEVLRDAGYSLEETIDILR